MKKYSYITRNRSAFTLVEVLVSMTILAIVMVSILMIYALSVQVAMKADLNREMQQNIKSVVETLATDIRKNGIKWTSIDYSTPYTTWTGVNLKLIDWPEFKLKKTEWSLECSDIKNVCTIYKYDKNRNELWPLTNSKISFTHLEYFVSTGAISKVTINMSVRAAIKNGVRPDLIKGSVIHFQTTISERSLQVK